MDIVQLLLHFIRAAIAKSTPRTTPKMAAKSTRISPGRRNVIVCAGYQKKGIGFLKTKFHWEFQFRCVMIRVIGIGVIMLRREPPPVSYTHLYWRSQSDECTYWYGQLHAGTSFLSRHPGRYRTEDWYWRSCSGFERRLESVSYTHLHTIIGRIYFHSIQIFIG